jgi:DNA-binding transcriptional LysR family regulator
MFENSDLKTFVRIADLRSLSGAARALGAPKSSVSRALARLEIAAGTALVERSYRHLRLTDAGNLLYPHARRILDDVDDAQNALSDYGGAPTGLLRLNAPSSFSRLIIAPMLPAFLARYEGVVVDLTVTDERRDMLTDGFDLTIRIGPLADSNLVARRLRSTELWACSSPSYVEKRGLPNDPGALGDYDLIGRSDKILVWLAEARKTKSVQLPVGRVTTVASDVVDAILIAGGGIGLLPDYVAQPAIARGELVRLFEDIKPLSVDVHAIYPDRRSLSAKVRAFIDALSGFLNAQLSERTVRSVPVDFDANHAGNCDE